MNRTAIIAAVLASTLSLTTNAQVTPAEYAHCSAVFKDSAVNITMSNGNLATVHHRVSDSLRNLAAAAIGNQATGEQFTLEMRKLRAERQGHHGNNVRQDSFEHCAILARNLGML